MGGVAASESPKPCQALKNEESRSTNTKQSAYNFLKNG
jgi:hypothetical protein